MTKQELIKKYQEIVLNTNGGNDDYVVALCQIGNLINELDEPSKEIAELKKQLEEKDKIIEMQKSIDRYDIGEMLTENVKLKQQLHTQPREIVDKIKSYCKKFITDGTTGLPQNFRGRRDINYLILEDYLNKILKEYGGESNED